MHDPNMDAVKKVSEVLAYVKTFSYLCAIGE